MPEEKNIFQREINIRNPIVVRIILSLVLLFNNYLLYILFSFAGDSFFSANPIILLMIVVIISIFLIIGVWMGYLWGIIGSAILIILSLIPLIFIFLAVFLQYAFESPLMLLFLVVIVLYLWVLNYLWSVHELFDK